MRIVRQEVPIVLKQEKYVHVDFTKNNEGKWYGHCTCGERWMGDSFMDVAIEFEEHRVICKLFIEIDR